MLARTACVSAPASVRFPADSFRAMPGVDQAGDVGMRQMGEDLALLQTALLSSTRIQCGSPQFHGDPLPHVAHARRTLSDVFR